MQDFNAKVENRQILQQIYELIELMQIQIIKMKNLQSSRYIDIGRALIN